MIPAVLYAVPAFLLLIVMEAVSYRFLPDDGVPATRSVTPARASPWVSAAVIGVLWGLVALVYAAIYTLTPCNSTARLWTWALLFFADDFAYYWFHRLHHEVRIFWAGHVVHHSSATSTCPRRCGSALPDDGTRSGCSAAAGLPAVDGVRSSRSACYQFFLHSERISRLWAPSSAFNTRRTTASTTAPRRYLDRNYGGILIIWDRLFRTFDPRAARRLRPDEEHRDVQPAARRHPRIRDIWRDVRAAGSWRHRLRFVFGRPGWQPS